MKKIILMLIASVIFVSCNAPTEDLCRRNAPTVVILSPGKAEIWATFTDFFDPIELVYFSSDNLSAVIVMDRNTGVLYIKKESGSQWGMSPIYDSDGSVLTKEKWLARRTEE